MNHEQQIRRVLDALIQYKLDNDGNTPTRDELANLVSINKTTLHTILRVLESRKLIRRDANRNKAAKIYITGAVWLLPEGWESPLEIAARHAQRRQEEARFKAARRAGLLCECGQDIVRWQKEVRFPRAVAIYMCDRCKADEIEFYGEADIEPYPKEETPNGIQTPHPPP